MPIMSMGCRSTILSMTWFDQLFTFKSLILNHIILLSNKWCTIFPSWGYLKSYRVNTERINLYVRIVYIWPIQSNMLISLEFFIRQIQLYNARNFFNLVIPNKLWLLFLGSSKINFSGSSAQTPSLPSA